MAATLWFSEQRVNTTTAGNQGVPAIAKLNNGGFVIVWQDPASDGDIRAQIFSAAGVKLGTEISVAGGVGVQVKPEVVAVNGPFGAAFRVVFEASGAGVQHFFNASGVFVAFGTPYGESDNFRSTTSAGGGYVDVFEFQTDIYLVRFGADGNTLAAGVVVNSTTAGSQTHPDVARLNNGQYVTVWVDGDSDIRARLVNAAGAPQGAGDFVVNSTALTTATGGRATVTALPSGGFVVVWNHSPTAFPGGGPSDIRARLFDAAGVPFGNDFLVNTSTAGQEYNPEIVALKDGGFLAIWNDFPASGGSFIRGVQFDATGGRVGSDFLISTGNAINTGNPRTISAVLLDDGRAAVTFIGDSGLGDPDDSIRVQILDPRNGQVEGTVNNDTLYGGQFDDQIIALAGNDTVFGLSGQDVIYGGLGNDTVFGDVGDDILYGGDDNDVLNAGTGADVVYAELGNDQVFAELGDDLVFGGDGNDTINGGAGDDAVYGQNGDDVMFGDAGADAFFGGFGNDTQFLGIGNDVGFGEEGGDTLIGDDGDDVLDGGAGGDVLNGGNGVDNLVGGADGDILIGGPGGDRIEGGLGGDLIWYQAQNEVNDLIVGYDPAVDQLQFTGSQFGGFTAGSNLSNGSTFISNANPNPTGAVPTFLYNSADGSLFFDADGTGPGVRIFVALIQGAPGLTAGDFQFV